jgi:prepilin-type N-terminal cleavage/methylation domain-containing protein
MRKGVTLTELMIVVAVIGVLMVAIQPYFYTLRRAWDYSDRRSDILQNARIGMDMMIRELREAKSFTSVTAAAEINGRIVFIDQDDNSIEFKRYNDGTNNMLGHVTGGNTSALAGPIDSLKFTCYEGDGLTATTNADDIRRVDFELVVADAQGKLDSETLSSKIFIRNASASTAFALVINEIMYNPDDGMSGNEDNTYEWVELYNYGDADIDVSGWQFQDGNATDNLQGDAVHGSGTTVIPAGGYAVITDQDTDVYDGGSPFTVDPAAIKLQVDDNDLGNGLHNSSDTITILDDTAATVDSVDYDDSWGAGGADGDGDSLERISTAEASNDPTNWEDSVLNGTPGSAN